MSEDMTEAEKLKEIFHIEEEEVAVSPWDRAVATKLALAKGIQLSDQHWELVDWLRHYYQEFGGIEYARDLSAMLEQRFHSQGGLRYLYTLFPGGPISQACFIAGLPTPKNSSDPSFGFSS